MADNIIKASVLVTDNGSINKVTKDAAGLNAQLGQTETTAAKASKALAATARASSAGGANKTAASASAAYRAETGSYGVARGVTGATGAESRDFAKQASGLGGLVHVYATFAANLFAVSAAFQALSKAADTTNMIKGLDQLGAASGRNLGSLSKRVAEATDGAVSLREAMQATAQSTAAGMSSTNLLRLTAVAKNTSQALGYSMPDALSRLSRGVSKIEPELLDELGIFVKIDKAVTDYARTVNKAASALTDYERRQAFANAVLAEGEEKFSNIELKANPYDKLLASLANVSQKGLETLNVVLGPIAKIMAESPMALVAALTAIGTVLLRMAIPAITNWRSNLRAAADEQSALAGRSLKEYTHYQEQLKTKYQDDIAQRVASQKAAVAQSLDVLKKGIVDEAKFGKNSNIYKLLAKDGNYDEKDYKNVSTQAKTASTNAMKAENALTAQSTELEKQNAAAIRARATVLRDLTKRMEEHAKGTLEFNAALKQANIDLNTDKDPGYWSGQAQRERISDSLNRKATTSFALSSLADDTQIMGPLAAFKKMLQNIKGGTFDVLDSNGEKILDKTGRALTKTNVALTGMAKAATVARGAMLITAVAVGTLVSSLGNLLGVIGIVVGAFMLLDSVASAASAYLDKASAAFDNFKESAAGSEAVLLRLSKISYTKFLNVENLQARANSFKELTDSIESVGSASQLALVKMNGWDKAWDAVKSVFGKGIKDNVQKSVVEGVSASAKLLNQGDSTAVYSKISSALNTSVKNAEELRKALNLDPSKAEIVTKVLAQLSQEASVAAAKGTELFESYKNTTKNFSDVITSLVPTDGLAKLGFGMIADSNKLADALNEPTQRLATLSQLSQDPNLFRYFSADMASDISNVSGEIKKIVDTISQASQSELALNEKIEEARSRLGKASRGKQQADIYKEIQGYLDAKTFVVKIKSDAENQASPFVELGRKAVIDSLTRGAKLVEASIGAGFAKAGAIMASASAGLLGDTEEGIRQRAKAQQLDLGIQARQIQASLSLVDALIDSTFEQRKNNILLQFANQPGRLDKELDKFNEDKARAGQLLSSKTALKELIVMMRGNDSAGELARTLLPSIQQKEAGKAQLAQLGAQSRAIGLTAEAEATSKKLLGEASERINAQLKLNEAAKAKLDIDKSSAAFVGLELVNKETELAQSAADLNYDKTRLDILDKIRKIGMSGSKVESINAAQAPLLKQLNEQNKAYAKEQENRDRTASINRIKAILEEFNYEQASNNAATNNKIANEQNILAIREEGLKTIEAYSVLEASDLIRRKTAIDLAKQDQESMSRRNQLFTDYASKYAELEAKRDTAAAGTDGENNPEVVKFEAAMTASTKYYTDSIIREATLTNARKAGISAIAEQNIELAKQAEVMNLLTSATESLATVFGDVGSAVGKTLQAITKSSQKQVNLKKTEEKAIADNKDGIEAEGKIRIRFADLSAKAELEGYAETAEAAKGLFKEKSFGYKALAATEKAIHIASLAMSAHKFAVESGFMQAIVAVKVAVSAAMSAIESTETAKSLATNWPGIVSTMFRQMGMWGYIGVGVAAAAIAAAGGDSGGVAMPGMSSDIMQKVQGTGVSSDSGGNFSQRAGGQLGDPFAKSDDIVRGIEVLAEYQFDTLTYDNKMLKALQAIQTNTKSFVDKLLQIPGITGLGSAFGTQESVVAPKLFGLIGGKSTTVEDTGIKLAGTIKDIIDERFLLTQYELSKIEKSGSFFGLFGGGTSYDTKLKEISGAPKSAISGLVSTIVETVTVGITTLFPTMFSTEALKTAIESYNLDLNTSLKGLSSSDAADTFLAGIGQQMNAMIESLVPVLKDYQKSGEGLVETMSRLVAQTTLVTDVFKLSGITMSNIVASTTSMPVNPALLAKKVADEEVVAALRETILGASSQNYGTYATQADVPSRYQQYAVEGLVNLGDEANTLVSAWVVDFSGVVATANAELAVANEALATSSAAVMREANASSVALTDTTDRLIALAGGMDTFKERAEAYIQGFRSEGETTQVVISGLKTRFSEISVAISNLGDTTLSSSIAAIKTRDDFAAVVKSLDTTTTAGAAAYTGLMSIAEQFASVTEEIKNVDDAVYNFDGTLKKASEDNSKYRELEIRLLELSGKEVEALAKTREDELKGLSELENYMQRYIWNMEAITTAQGRLDEIQLSASQKLIKLRTKEKALVEDFLHPMYDYLYAIEDLQTAQEGLKTAYEEQSAELTATINKLKSASTSLKEFRNQLLLGSESTLTPKQKYDESRSQYMAVLETARSTGTTDADIAARDAALSKIPQASQAFLAASKAFYASSATYTSDFNTVTSAAESIAAALDSQVTDTELMLTEMRTSTSALISIEDSVKTVAEWIIEVKAARGRVNITEGGYTNLIDNILAPAIRTTTDMLMGVTTASNNVASGTSAIDDFSPVYGPVNPYTANQSVNTYSGSTNQLDAVVSELQELRNEVVLLRTEQRRQTGDMIISNYDANRIAAEEVSEAVNDAIIASEWDSRSQVRVA